MLALLTEGRKRLHLSSQELEEHWLVSKDRFNTISAILRSTGKVFETTATADEAVNLKHFEILRRNGRWTDLSRAAQLLLSDAFA